MTQQEMTIGRLAKATHCKPETIRYYEQIGLMPAPARNHAGYRLYSESHQRRLSFIRKGRDLGFSLEDIGSLLALTEDHESSCLEISRLSRQHLATISVKINQLIALSNQLNSMITQCSDGRTSECRIIESLLDNDLPDQSDKDAT